jgi:hypothetical protein
MTVCRRGTDASPAKEPRRKPQRRPLTRTQPRMPMKRGRAGTMTYDYRWHGTVDAFAASDVATGKIIR